MCDLGPVTEGSTFVMTAFNNHNLMSPMEASRAMDECVARLAPLALAQPVVRVIDMTIDLYRPPVTLVDGISALGLRLLGFGIHADFMSSFVTACVEVVQGTTKDNVAVESFGWPLTSTATMQAINVTTSGAS